MKGLCLRFKLHSVFTLLAYRPYFTPFSNDWGGGVSEVSTKAVILVHLKISEPRNVEYNEDFFYRFVISRGSRTNLVWLPVRQV